MNLIDTINKDVTNALKNRNSFNLSVLRMLKSSLKNEEITKKRELSDEEAIMVIKKQVKLRKDSIVEYEKYGKQDEIESLNNEINLLSKYLPEEMSTDDIEKLVCENLNDGNEYTMKDFGNLMKKLNPLFKGKADMKIVSECVKNHLK